MEIRPVAWDCPYCGRKANRGVAPHCGGCGAPRGAEVALYATAAPGGDDAAAIVTIARAQAQWTCATCAGTNPVADGYCGACGACRHWGSPHQLEPTHITETLPASTTTAAVDPPASPQVTTPTALPAGAPAPPTTAATSVAQVPVARRVGQLVGMVVLGFAAVAFVAGVVHPRRNNPRTADRDPSPAPPAAGTARPDSAQHPAPTPGTGTDPEGDAHTRPAAAAGAGPTDGPDSGAPPPDRIPARPYEPIPFLPVLRTDEEPLTVVGFHWERTIEVQQWLTTTHETEKDPPAGARVTSKEQIVDHYERVKTGTTVKYGPGVEKVKTGTKRVRWGRYYVNVPVYEDRPVKHLEETYENQPRYRTKYVYETDETAGRRTERASGDGRPPAWPALHLTGREKETGRTETYRVEFTNERDGRRELTTHDLNEWLGYQKGARYAARAAASGQLSLLRSLDEPPAAGSQ